MPFLTFINGNKKVNIPFTDTPLLRNLLCETGNAVSSPCGGKGVCGKCKVLLSGAVSEPNEKEIKAGCRLACQAVLFGDAVAEVLFDEQDALIETSTAESFFAVDKSDISWKFGAAIDIGTTTVALKLFSKEGKCVGESACLNPQVSVSADVIGRISFALEGNGVLLQRQITDCIDTLLSKACKQAGISSEDVEISIIAGNTAMLYFFTNRSPKSISCYPFRSETLFGEWVGNAYLPPCMDAFVGADVTCAVLSSGICDSSETALLCDMGTNGEIALWKDGVLYVTSTAAGPAFEGAEISCGCGSVSGAVDRVWIENGAVKAHTVGDCPAIGVCGSGLIDAIAVFLKLGYISENGSVEKPLIISANGGQIQILPQDVCAVQLAKAAIAAGIEVIMSRSKTSLEEVKVLCLAGGFGSRLSPESAADIGLIPSALAAKAKVIGNGALGGASQMLFDSTKIQKAEGIASCSQHINLGGSVDFNLAYIDNMVFPEIEISTFDQQN